MKHSVYKRISALTLTVAMLATTCMVFAPVRKTSAANEPANMLSSGSFEQDADNNQIPDGWTPGGGNANANITRVTDKAAEGTASARFHFSADAGRQTAPVTLSLSSELMPVTYGTYRFSVKAASAGALSGVRLKAYWYNSSFALLGNPAIMEETTYTNGVPEFSDWVTRSKATRTPSGAVWVKYVLEAVSASADSGDLWVDDLNMTPGTEDPTGNLVANGNFEEDATLDGSADNWKDSAVTGGSSKLYSQLAAGGSQSLRFEFPTGTKSVGAYNKVQSQQYIFNLDSASTYTGRVWYTARGTQLDVTLNVHVIWSDASFAVKGTSDIVSTVLKNQAASAGPWQVAEAKMNVPAGADRALVEATVTCNNRTTSGEVFVDQIYLGRNVLTNGDMETGDLMSNSGATGGPDGLPDGWDIQSAVTGVTAQAVSISGAPEGTRVTKVTVPSGASVTPGDTVTVSSKSYPVQKDKMLTGQWYTRLNGGVSAADASIVFTDANNQLMAIQPLISHTIYPADTAEESSWNKKGLSLVVPAGAEQAKLQLKLVLPGDGRSAEVMLDSAFLGVSSDLNMFPNNEKEDVLDSIWNSLIPRTTNYWKMTDNTGNGAGRSGINALWDSMQIWYKQDAGKANAIAYSRDFNLLIEDTYDQIIVDETAPAGKLITIEARYTDKNGAEHVARDTREGTGSWMEIPVNIMNGQKLISITLRLEDMPGAQEINNDLCAASYHWILIKRPGDVAKPAHTMTEMTTNIADPLTEGVPVGLLFSRTDIAGLRQKITQGSAKDQWDQMRVRCEAYLSYQPEADIDTYLNPTQSSSNAMYARDNNDTPLGWYSKIMELSFAYLMTDDLRYASMARRIMMCFVDTPEWSQSFMWRKPDQAAAEKWAPFNESTAVLSMSLAYDWLYNCLTTEERAAVKNAISTKGMPYIRSFLDKQTYWKTMNQGLEFSAAYAVGGIVTGDTEAVNYGKECLKLVINNYYKADGDTDEGTGYWMYSTASTLLGAEVLSRYNSAWDNELKTEYFKQTLNFMVYMSSMAASKPLTTMNYNEGIYGGVLNSYHSGAYIASEFDNGVARWAWENSTNRDEAYTGTSVIWGNPVLGILFTGDTVAKAPVLPRNKYIAGSGYLFMRSGWEFGKDMMFGLISGNWSGGHSHADKNAFVLEGYGTRFVADRGTTSYADPAVDNYRATASHNTVTLNGADQVFVRAAAAATPERQFASPLFDYFVSEGKNAYNDVSTGRFPMNSFRRSVIYVRPDVWFMLDNVIPNGSAVVDWNMHTLQSRNASGNHYTFADTKGTLDVEVLRSSGAILAPEEAIKGDAGRTQMYTFRMSTPTAVTSAEFLTVFRPKQTGTQGFSTTSADSVYDVQLPDGHLFATTANTTSAKMATDAKFALAYQKTGSTEINSLGVMNGSQMKWNNTVLMKAVNGTSAVTMDAAVEWLDAHTVNGKIKADGACTVTLTSPVDSSYQVNVVFTAAGEQIISNTFRSLSALRSSETLFEGSSRVLTLTARRYDDTEIDLSEASTVWSSSNPGVAAVSPDGKVTAIGTGTSDIQAAVTLDGQTLSTTVHVVCQPAPQGNLVTNPGFEEGTGGGWEYSFTNGAVATADTTMHNGGSKSLKLDVNPSQNDGMEYALVSSNTFDVTGGSSLETSWTCFQTQNINPAQSTGKNKLQALIQWFDKDGYRLSGQDSVITDAWADTLLSIPGGSSSGLSKVNWLAGGNVVSSVTAPAGAVSGRIMFRWHTDQKNVANLWIDDVSVVRKQN